MRAAHEAEGVSYLEAIRNQYLGIVARVPQGRQARNLRADHCGAGKLKPSKTLSRKEVQRATLYVERPRCDCGSRAAKPNAEFIQRGRRKDACMAHRRIVVHNAASREEGLKFTGDGAFRRIVDVTPVKAVFLREIEIHPLHGIILGRSRAGIPDVPRQSTAYTRLIRARKQVDIGNYGRMEPIVWPWTHGLEHPIRIRQQPLARIVVQERGHLRDPLPLPEPFVVCEEENLVPDQPPSQRSPKLVPAKRQQLGTSLALLRNLIEEVPGIEDVVAHEFVGAAVKLVGAGAGDRTEHSPHGVAPVLRAKAGGQKAELANRFDSQAGPGSAPRSLPS